MQAVVTDLADTAALATATSDRAGTATAVATTAKATNQDFSLYVKYVSASLSSRPPFLLFKKLTN